MRKQLFLIIALLLVGSLPVAGQEELVLEQSYHDEFVSFHYPAGWNVFSDGDGDVFLSSNLTSLGALLEKADQLNLDYEEIVIELLYASYWDLSPQNVTNTSVIGGYLMAWDLAVVDTVTEFQVRQVEETEVSGHPATLIEYTIIGENDSRFAHFFLVTLLINDGAITVIGQTRSGLDDYYPVVVSITEAVIETLDFTPPE